MYLLTGLKNNIENILYLSKTANPDVAITGWRSLKKGYQELLERIQPGIPARLGNEPAFILDSVQRERLRAVFNVDCGLNDLRHSILRDREGSVPNPEMTARVSRELSEIYRISPEFSDLFRLACNGLYLARSLTAGGGTTSAAIGVIWMDPRPTWRSLDYYEFVVHETTHTLMFLDERRHQHYFDLAEIVRHENHYPSAILAVRRPLDKVLHSLVVATELLLHRETLIGHPVEPKAHPPSNVLLSKALHTANALLGNSRTSDLVTSRGMELVRRCDAQLRRIKAGSGKELQAC